MRQGAWNPPWVLPVTKRPSGRRWTYQDNWEGITRKQVEECCVSEAKWERCFQKGGVVTGIESFPEAQRAETWDMSTEGLEDLKSALFLPSVALEGELLFPLKVWEMGCHLLVTRCTYFREKKKNRVLFGHRSLALSNPFCTQCPGCLTDRKADRQHMGATERSLL